MIISHHKTVKHMRARVGACITNSRYILIDFIFFFCQKVASTFSVLRLNKCSLCNALIVVVVLQPFYDQTEANKCGKNYYRIMGFFILHFSGEPLCADDDADINQNSLKY